jgi:hypothetical protein
MPFGFSLARFRNLPSSGSSAGTSSAAGLFPPRSRSVRRSFERRQHFIHRFKTRRNAAFANIVEAVGDLSINEAALDGRWYGDRKFILDGDGHEKLLLMAE